MSRPAFALALAGLAAVAACEQDGPTTTPAPGDAPAAEAPAPAAGADSLARLLADMDRTADPCADFYRYACGGWLDRTTLPPDKPRWSRAFNGIQDRNQALLREVLDRAAADPGDDPLLRKLGDFHAACMDTAAIAAAGRGPLDPILADIAAVSDKKALMAQIGKLHATVWGRVGWISGGASPPFFHVVTEPDAIAAPKTEIAMFVQSGLGLPARAMYLGKDEGTRQVLEAYRAHVAAMLALAGESPADAEKHAKAIVALETALARASKEPADLRDFEKNYHKEGAAGLAKRAKGLDWDAYFAASGYPASPDINVAQPAFFGAMAGQIRRTDLETLKSYLRWHTTQAMAHYLAPAIQQPAFELARLTQGVQALPERWKQCVDEAMWALPELLGKPYADRAFAGESKAIALAMIGEIFDAMESTFPTLAWMDEVTGRRASEKIRALTPKIGYPDRWRDYGALAIDRRSYFANALAERAFEHARKLGKIDQPRDMAEWLMPTPLVNAYAHQGEITFPAGILQPPFFAQGQPAAMNFGGIGAVIGHELTHHFDDQGRKYDKDGRLHAWWEPEVSKRFEERVACVVGQYDAYEALPDLHVNGRLTAGENIADIGGVKQAHIAFTAWKEQQAAATAATPELTDEQLFFVAWAQNWCEIQAEPSLRRRVETDPHSPGRFRAEGPLADFPAFWDAFSCAEGTPMHPKNACEVW